MVPCDFIQHVAVLTGLSILPQSWILLCRLRSDLAVMDVIHDAWDMTGIRGADIDCQKLAKGRGAMYNGIAVRVWSGE